MIIPKAFNRPAALLEGRDVCAMPKPPLPVRIYKPGNLYAVIQNSSRTWNATIRGELSPPKPTPNNPVGGAVVDVNVPKPV